jgi:hypothetical protein
LVQGRRRHKEPGQEKAPDDIAGFVQVTDDRDSVRN